MDVFLIAGVWLPRSIWAEVGAELEHLGHRALPVALPGVDDASTNATLPDQVRAVLAAVDAADRPMVVGHSAACPLAWMVADQRPEAKNVAFEDIDSGHWPMVTRPAELARILDSAARGG